MSEKLTHVDADGKLRMVDVSNKSTTARVAVARGKILLKPETLKLIEENSLGKGDVINTAKVAGVMAAKKTAELIPLAHPLSLTHVEINITPNATDSALEIEAAVKTTDKTGVEMEALTAVSVTALTIYDMAKAVDKEMVITDILLMYKSGGKSGEFKREAG